VKRNLCLDIKLPDPPIPRVFIGVDPAGKDGISVVTSPPWMPGLDAQSISRLKRTPLPPTNDLTALNFDFSAIERRILGQLVDKQMTSQMLKAIANPYDRSPTERGESDLYKTTLQAAMVTKGELDIGDVLTPRDFTQMPPDVVEAWIWGPHGEFTALARSPDLNRFLRERDRNEVLTYNIDRSGRLDRDLDRDGRHRGGGRQVTFRQTIMRRAYRESSAYSPFGYRDSALRDTQLVVFKSYADYALWADYDAEQVYLSRGDR
jgi:hypothetical protein